MNHNQEQLPEWFGDAPVLFYGARKAGTTLLQNLCDGGDELFVYSTELKLKKLLKTFWSGDAETIIRQYEDECVIQEVPDLDFDEYKSHMAQLKDKDIQSLRELIEWHMYAVFKSVNVLPRSINRWGIKEVGGDTEAVICQWRHMYLYGKIVLILRNPLMTVRSVIRQRRSNNVRLSVTRIYREVKDPYQVMTAITRRFDDQSVYILCYENMTENTEKVVKGICEYIGIEYHEKMNQPTLFGNSVIVNTSSRVTNKVFKTDVSWKNDLTFREVACVTLAKIVLRVRNIFVRTRDKINLTPYEEIVQQIPKR